MTEPSSESQPSGRAASLVAAGILLSRVAGLIREIAIATFLPVNSIGGEAFRFALRIPNTVQNLLGEGALSASFIPVYSRMLDPDNPNDSLDRAEREKNAAEVAGVIASLLVVLTAALVLVGVVGARPLTALLMPGRRGPVFEQTVTLVRIMFPGIGLLVLSAWCLGVLNSHRRFFLAYVAPVLWNLVQIGFVTFAGLRGFTDGSTAQALAWGLVVGSLAQVLIQLPTVRRVAPGLVFGLRSKLDETGEVVRRFLPAVLGRGVVQLSAFADLILVSYLALGAVQILSFTQVLYLLPISLFGISIAAAELPELSQQANNPVATKERLRTAMRRVVFFVTFTALAYIIVGRPIASLLFEQFGQLIGRGKFNADDSLAVGLTLGAYSLGLIPAATSRVVQNMLYAHGDVRGPAIIAVGRMIVSSALGVVLMFQFDQVLVVDAAVTGLENIGTGLAGPLPATLRQTENLPLRLGVIGLGLASSAASWIQLGLLERRLREQVCTRSWIGANLRWITPAALAAAVVLAGGAYLLRSLNPVLATPLVVGSGGVVYVVVAHLRRIPEASQLLRRLRLVS